MVYVPSHYKELSYPNYKCLSNLNNAFVHWVQIWDFKFNRLATVFPTLQGVVNTYKMDGYLIVFFLPKVTFHWSKVYYYFVLENPHSFQVFRIVEKLLFFSSTHAILLVAMSIVLLCSVTCIR